MVRDIRGYHIVSTETANALTLTPTWDLEVEVLAEVYRRTVYFRSDSGWKQVREWREAVRRGTMACWSSRLETPRISFAAAETLQSQCTRWRFAPPAPRSVGPSLQERIRRFHAIGRYMFSLWPVAITVLPLS